MGIDMNNVKVDRANMCIDRNTELGRQFENFNEYLKKEQDPAKRAFMSQMAAYAEAAMVIDTIYPGELGKKKLGQLARQMAE